MMPAVSDSHDCGVMLDKDLPEYLPDFPQAVRANWAIWAWRAWSKPLSHTGIYPIPPGLYCNCCSSRWFSAALQKLVWYLLISEWIQNTAEVCALCAPHGPKQGSFCNLEMGILQTAEFQSEFWDFLCLWPGLEEMLEIKKRLFYRISGKNTALSHIWCGYGYNCNVSELMGD